MNRYTVLLLLLAIVLIWGGCAQSSVITPVSSGADVMTVGDPAGMFDVATTQAPATAKIFPPSVLAASESPLEKYKDYAIQGIVFDMLVEEMQDILGEVEGKPLPGTDTIVFQYGNIEIWTSPDYKDGKVVESIDVLKGDYLGLTVGKSTKEDADKRFGIREDDLYMEEPDGSAFNGYRDRDGVTIYVHYQDGLITKIGTAPAGLP
jgi:hypothetical protein